MTQHPYAAQSPPEPDDAASGHALPDDGTPDDGAPDDGAPDGSAPDDVALDPAEMLRIIREQRLAVRDRVEPDARLLFGTWGTAWLVGHLVLWSTARSSAGSTPSGWSFAIFFTLLAAAIAITIVHTVRRSLGVDGPSARTGAMYGWTWTIGFVAIYLIMTGLTRADASPQIINLGWIALPCLLVGLLYLAAGAMWQSNVMYVLGAWIVLVGGAATVVGLPGTFLVMAFAGGGGMLLAALVTHVREYRKVRSA